MVRTASKTRWQGLALTWIELGDWDWHTPSLKKVYEYAKVNSNPKRKRRDRGDSQSSNIPDEHTFIMCVAKSDNGCVGWFVPILIWPFHKTYTAETYHRSAEEHRIMHSRNGRAGIWEIFTNTTHAEMVDHRMKLAGTKPLDLNELQKRYKLSR